MQAASVQKPPRDGFDLKVEGEPGLVRRDVAIVSMDDRAYQAALSRRRAVAKGQEKFDALQRRVEGLESKLDEIHGLLLRMAK